MNAKVQSFDVRVRDNGTLKTIQVFASNPRQAAKMCGKPNVVGVRKTDRFKILGDITKLSLEQQPLGFYIGDGLYDADISLDEILSLRRAKRIQVNRDKKNST